MRTRAVGNLNLNSPYFAGGSAAQKAYFLKTNIMELKIGLNARVYQ